MLKEYLINQNIYFEQDRPLSELTTFRIGGKAEIIIYPDTPAALSALIKFLRQNGIKYFVMGNGSNLLFSDDDFSIPIIKTDKINHIVSDGDIITFGAGVKLVNAANHAAELGLTGMEFAHGIPGSVGGAVYMNAGAYDGAMNQIVIETGYIDEYGESRRVIGDAHDFSYRHSCFSHKNLIIFETKVSLKHGDKVQIKEKMTELMRRRKEKQPLNLPSAGSTFKRPEGAFAGQLIEQCGLRGFTIGGAGVSEKHCGFVVNNNSATFADVMNVIRHVQHTVKEKTGYVLECEVEIIDQENQQCVL